MGDAVFAVNHTFQSAAVANANGTALGVGGLPAVGVQVEGITTATVTFEGTIDGSTWYAIQAVTLTNGTIATSTAADGLFMVPVTGLDQFRCRISGYSAGTITVSGKAVTHGSGTLNDIDVAGTETVTVGSITAGETVIGRVGSVSASIPLTPTITGGAYSAGDAVGGLLTFTNAARVSGYGGVIKNVLIVDDAGQDAELELWLFDQTFTNMSDNAPWAPSEADLENLIVVISTEDSGQGWMAAGTPSACDIEVARSYKLTGTSMFGQLVTRGTPTFAATDDVTVTISLLQD